MSVNWFKPGTIFSWSRRGSVGPVNFIAIYIGPVKISITPKFRVYVLMSQQIPSANGTFVHLYETDFHQDNIKILCQP